MAKSEPAKSEFLQVRLSPSEKARIEAAATGEHLAPSTWARQVLLTALDKTKATS